MAHGYLGDGYGIHGESEDRDDRREHGSRDEWRRDERWRDHDRGMMFRDRGNENPFDARARDFRQGNRDFGSSSDFREGRRSFSAHPDDHYRSWRDRHMGELDRDYEDYCREREQAFHRDFDTWRSQRHASYEPLRTGMTQSGMSHDPSGEVQLTTEAEAEDGIDPTSEATLGTNSSAEAGRRGRR